jgi:hypothetical protein
MGDETQYTKLFKDAIEAHGGMATSLAGGVFMAGMPDVLCVSRFGAIILVENKFWRKAKHPENFHELQAQLKGPQIAVIKHKLWKLSAPCLLVTQLELDKDLVYVNYKNNISLYKWRDLAKSIASTHTSDELLESLRLL